MVADELTIPLVPSRRVSGQAFGLRRSSRRGHGADVVGIRAYSPGDDVRRIHWAASARRSQLTAGDDFLVREFHAEESPLVLLALDRSPTMALYGKETPWLHKPAAAREIVALLARSATAERAPLAYLEAGSPPATPRRGAPLLPSPVREEECLGELLAELERLRLGPGSLVFVASDFLGELPQGALERLARRRWDVVPVVLQDPVWERDFPAVAGCTLYVRELGGEPTLLRLSRDEVAARQERNRARYRALLASFASCGLSPVVVSSAAAPSVAESFLRWARDREQSARGRGR
jgi:uncharacterized protein (DUF58 family)